MSILLDYGPVKELLNYIEQEEIGNYVVAALVLIVVTGVLIARGTAHYRSHLTPSREEYVF